MSVTHTTTLTVTAAKGGLVARGTGSTSPALSRKVTRTIKKVIDLRGDDPVVLPVDSLLDGLTAVDLSSVRRATTDARGQGRILFRCAQCNSPLQLSSGRESSTGDGRGAYFKHAHRTPARCSWYTPETLRSAGANQFAGLQEGEPHRRLKHLLADSIGCDPNFSEPVVDKHFIKIGDGHRKPDVFTTYRGRPVAFELQLARLPTATLTQRISAYRAAGITLVWVTSAHELALLNNQAFRDLYLAAGGRILAVDAASFARSQETSVLHLRELSLEPVIQHHFAIFNRWRSRMVGPDVIFMLDGQRHVEGQRVYAATLAEKLEAKAPGLTEKIAGALVSGSDPTRVAAEWSALAKLIGGRDLRQSIQDELPRALRWLQAVEQLSGATTPDKQTAGQVVAALTAAILISRTGKHWVPLIEHVADAVPAVAAVLRPDLRGKMAVLRSSPGKLHPFHAYHRHMLSALHPWLSFWLLAKSPASTAPHQRLTLAIHSPLPKSVVLPLAHPKARGRA